MMLVLVISDGDGDEDEDRDVDRRVSSVVKAGHNYPAAANLAQPTPLKRRGEWRKAECQLAPASSRSQPRDGCTRGPWSYRLAVCKHSRRAQARSLS
jgi:hypothetical protein